jgi:hypothetical protein
MENQGSRPEDVSDLERRLSDWKPDTDGLDLDSMLFAAGRAAARSGTGRLLWPAIVGCLTLLTATLGVLLVSERTERLLLARQMTPGALQVAGYVAPVEPSTSQENELPPHSLLAFQQALQKGLETWLEQDVPGTALAQSPPGPAIHVLQVWESKAAFDP